MQSFERWRRSSGFLGGRCTFLKYRIIVLLLRPSFWGRRAIAKSKTAVRGEWQRSGCLGTTVAFTANFILPVFVNWASKDVTGPYAPKVCAPFLQIQSIFLLSTFLVHRTKGLSLHKPIHINILPISPILHINTIKKWNTGRIELPYRETNNTNHYSTIYHFLEESVGDYIDP